MEFHVKKDVKMGSLRVIVNLVEIEFDVRKLLVVIEFESRKLMGLVFKCI